MAVQLSYFAFDLSRTINLTHRNKLGTGYAAPVGTSIGDFDWRVYADATCAGLSVLVPIPLVDLAFETFFRRRMPATICRARGFRVDAATLLTLRRRRGPLLDAHGCLMLPIAGVFYLLKRLSRKILYFLTIREATEQLSYYWHRAFLIDHMARRGHCQGSPASVAAARTALEQTLDTAETSPLLGLARTTVKSGHRVLRMLIRARRRGPDQEVRVRGEALEDHWADVSTHFDEVAAAFDAAYSELVSALRNLNEAGQ